MKFTSEKSINLCPDTIHAINCLVEEGIAVEFKDIFSCHAVLRGVLHICETSCLYADIRGIERIGVPWFIREDGFMTLEMKDILG